jgi:hypothetical protein
MEEASEGVRRPGLNVALGDLVKGAIKELEVYETGRDATLVIQDSTVEA